MYVPVWLLVLVVAPWALSLTVGVVILLGMHALLGVSRLGEALSAGLALLLIPARHLGPWFDYVAVIGVMAGSICLALLLI